MKRVDIVALIAEHCFSESTFTKRTQRVNFICPFHSCDGKPNTEFSLVAVRAPLFNTKTDWFKCYACGARGCPADFLMQYHKYVLGEAVEVLNQREARQ